MQVGVCILPESPATEVIALLNRYPGQISSVNILAVNPGVGGQSFQPSVLNKVRIIREGFSEGELPYLSVDGGINEETAVGAVEAGDNIFPYYSPTIPLLFPTNLLLIPYYFLLIPY